MAIGWVFSGKFTSPSMWLGGPILKSTFGVFKRKDKKGFLKKEKWNKSKIGTNFFSEFEFQRIYYSGDFGNINQIFACDKIASWLLNLENYLSSGLTSLSKFDEG